ncbi:MAG: ABC transporter permease [Muribaculaceae bacterium]|nr:ABC transporter permease [Muribaculaceae bacterium]
MKQLRSFIKKEFIHILRDPRSLLILLVMPLLLVILPGYVIKNDVKDIRVAVIDRSRDEMTSQIIDRLASNSYFHLTDNLDNEEEALNKFKNNEIDLAVIFGPDFADRLLHTHDAEIQIIADGSEPNQATVRVTYAQQVIAQFQKELQQQAGLPAGMNIRIANRMLYNPQQRSEVNFVPGIIAMIILLICCMMTSVAIVRERETGTMEILLASPLPTIVIVLAKLVPYLVISLLDLAAILCISVFLMDIPMEGNLILYLAVSFIYILTALMLGLLISTVIKTQMTAMLISLLLIIPTIYLSGMVFDIASMPLPAQIVSNIVPAKWFILASRKIMIEGVEASYVMKELMILVAELIVFLLLAWKFFKTRLE